MWRFLAFLGLVGCVHGQCQNVNFVSRSQWGSQLPLPSYPLDMPVSQVYFHHTVTPECPNRATCSARMRQMQEFHAGLGWGDIGYNFVIGGDGGVYVGRGWQVQGIHTLGHNQGSLGIAFVGNFQNKDPSPQMVNAAKNLLACGVVRGDLSNSYGLYGARDGTCTDSPGLHFYNSLKSWPHWHKQGEVNKVC